jgi:hypothetical protein
MTTERTIDRANERTIKSKPKYLETKILKKNNKRQKKKKKFKTRNSIYYMKYLFIL